MPKLKRSHWLLHSRDHC